mgnify:CR=1 FL=1
MTGHRARARRLLLRERMLIGLELALSIGAVGGAVGMFLDPAGTTSGLDVALADLPVPSLVLPGVALLLVNGVLPAAVAIGALRRAPWAPWGHLVVGVALLGWLLVQFWFIGGGHWLQALYVVWGLAITALALPAFGLRDS